MAINKASQPKIAAGWFFALLAVYLFTSCGRTDPKQHWRFQKTIALGDVQPIGLVKTNNEFWISDAGNNRVLLYSHEGGLLQALSEGVDYPADVLILKRELFVVNFGGKSLGIYAGG